MTSTGFPLVTSLVMTCLVFVTQSQAAAAAFDTFDVCTAVCSNPDQYAMLLPSVTQRCHCGEVLQRTTRSPTITTTDICDYLCSIQLGGQACECSRPSLPGRK
ncbi:uncharacterized protein LOC143276563 [Babylonia areolata]|uniref:uncharacterized protein LOC143276563 n=1 Tax=Babylonia areolata TaxID=304850 RepID=UPI003FD40C24